MKHVYMVQTRQCTAAGTLRNAAHLGAHTSLASAQQHVREIVTNRRGYHSGVQVVTTHPYNPGLDSGPEQDISRTDIMYNDGEAEYLSIQKWRLCTMNKRVGTKQ